METYIIINQYIVDQYSGKESTVNPTSFFGYGQTLNGDFVTHINTLVDFPELKELKDLPVINLRQDEFPSTPLILES
jgi:hypothetical protein